MDVNDNNFDSTDGAVSIDTNHAKTVDNSDGSPDNPAFSAPLKRDSKGRFIRGTGTRGHLGGRPKGAKDKVSVKFLEIMEAVIEDKGAEMMLRLAEENPAAALAIISRSLPQKAMQEAVDGVAEDSEPGAMSVTINLAAPDPKALERSHVERLTSPDDDLEMVVPEPSQEPTQADMDEVARDKAERQKELIRQHGGLTGRRARASAPNAIDYADDPSIV